MRFAKEHAAKRIFLLLDFDWSEGNDYFDYHAISELKANLSRYVREVRRGGEVQVLHRGTPVARLVPLVEHEGHGVRERLIHQGIVKPGDGNTAATLDKPPLVLPTSIREVLADDRDDRL